MAITNYSFNSSSAHGSLLRNALNWLEMGHTQLPKVRDTMQANIDGDGSQASHFDAVRVKFGFATLEEAKAAWEELNSAIFKITTNASVTDVDAALKQVFTKLRA